MTTAMIFYRTPSTTKTDVPDPNDLPDAQKLLWTPPADLAKKIQDTYTNNIVVTIPTLPFGRRINQNDEGSAGWKIIVEGDYFADTGDSSSKLHAMEIVPQADDYHVFGCFGILWPNGPTYLQSIDPDDTRGLMLETRSGVHIGLTGKLVDFSVQFSYGGDVE